jgi:hypothetical protein
VRYLGAPFGDAAQQAERLSLCCTPLYAEQSMRKAALVRIERLQGIACAARSQGAGSAGEERNLLSKVVLLVELRAGRPLSFQGPRSRAWLRPFLCPLAAHVAGLRHDC